MAQEGAGQEESCVQVHAEVVPPLVRADGRHDPAASPMPHCVMDEDGECAAETFERFLHSRLVRRLVAHVHPVHLRASARGGLFLLARPVRRLIVGAVEERDVRSGIGQGLGDGAPDVSRAARNKRRLARKVDGVHSHSLLKPPMS